MKYKLDKGTLELLKHGKHYISASVLVKGLSVISIPIMTRLLTPSDYGLLGVYSSFITIMIVFYGLGIRGAVSRYYYEKSDDFGSFIVTSTFLLICWGIFFSIFIYINRVTIAGWMNLPPNLITLGSITAFLGAIYQLVYAYLRASKQSSRVSKIVMIQAVGSLIVTISITSYLKDNRYLGSVYSKLLFNFFLFTFGLYILKRIGSINIKKQHITYSLIFGIPMIFHLLSSYIMNNFDQVMINKMVGSTETGLYSFAYKVGMLFQLFATGMNQAWTPLFYQNLRDKKYDTIDIIAKKYSAIVGGVALLLVIFTPLLVKLLASAVYSTALPIIPVIILGFIFQYFYFMYTGYAFYEKKTKSIAGITIISGLINIGLNYFLIPIFGYNIAAWTTVATYIIFFLLSYLNIKLIIKPTKIIRLSSILTPGLIAIILIITVMFTKNYNPKIWKEIIIDSCCIIIYFLSIYFINKKR